MIAVAAGAVQRAGLPAGEALAIHRALAATAVDRCVRSARRRVREAREPARRGSAPHRAVRRPRAGIRPGTDPGRMRHFSHERTGAPNGMRRM